MRDCKQKPDQRAMGSMGQLARNTDITNPTKFTKVRGPNTVNRTITLKPHKSNGDLVRRIDSINQHTYARKKTALQGTQEKVTEERGLVDAFIRNQPQKQQE